jgi:uncharacterized protein
MSLAARIEKDFVVAYKAKDQVRVQVLRLLKAAMKNRQVEAMRELSEEDVLSLLAKQVKQREESIEQFSAAGRTDLSDKEAAEMAVLKEYLPAPLSPAELEALVLEAVRASGAAGPKDMGKVMALLMPQVQGRADGKAVSGLVKAKLTA